MEIVERLLKGDVKALSRLITYIDDGKPEALKAIAELYPYTGKAHIVGFTGAPGVGKSSLINLLIKELRKRGKTVGVVCVDPSSPFTQGAFLGDRIRMVDLSLDDGVFIRSMGSRGSLGGPSRSTRDVVKVLDAFGKDYVIVETVGSGQVDMDIVQVAHTVVIVLAPGLGDSIQALKAGIMEIGDIFVVNKADREDADKTLYEIREMLDLKPVEDGWVPPIIKTTVVDGRGVEELLQAVEQRMEYLKKNNLLVLKMKQMMEAEIMNILKLKLASRVSDLEKTDGVLTEAVAQVGAKQMDPYTAAEKILAKINLKKAV